MHLALVIPAGLAAASGNVVMAERLALGLRAHGLKVSIITADGIAARASKLAGFTWLHAFHALKAGQAALAVAQATGTPLTVTCTGTDVEVDAHDPAKLEGLERVLNAALGIATLHEGMSAALIQRFPHLAPKIAAIPQGPLLVPPAGTRREDWGLSADHFVFLLPAGLRAVKRPGLALEPLAELHRDFPHLRLLVAGPPREPEAARAFIEELRGRPWARYLGEVPREQLMDLYQLSDVVLNTSAAEGMPNALLEAMALGRPVLASNIPGNRALIEPEVNGLLSDGAASFYTAARRLLTDADLRARLALKAKQTIAQHFRPEAEIAGYLELLRRAGAPL